MSLCLVSRLPSPVSWLCSLSPVLCPLSHGSSPCLPSYVPCLTALLLVSRPMSPVSRLCSLFSVPCTLSISKTIPVSPFMWLYSTGPVLRSSVCRPLFLPLLSSVHCLSYLRECEFFYTCKHLMAGYELVLYLSFFPSLTSLYFVSHSMYPVSELSIMFVVRQLLTGLKK